MTRIAKIPPYLEPGYIPIAEAVPASKPAVFYAQSPNYMGQAVGVGELIAVHAVDFDVRYQKRDGHFLPIPSLKMDEALRNATAHFRRFVLIGRLTYFDAAHRPHADEITCDLANQALEQFNREILPVLFVSECLYLDQDLTLSHRTKRLAAAEEITDWLKFNMCVSCFRLIEPAVTSREKLELLKNFDRILWAKWNAPYLVKNETYVITSKEDEE